MSGHRGLAGSRRVAGALAAAAIVALSGAAPARAADRSRGAKAPAPATAVPATEAAETSPEARPADGKSEAKPDAKADAKSNARPGKPARPRVYTFSGLDVEGKLKTPQLLYFLGRVRLELDTTVTPKRSFMKELGETADAEGL